MKSYTNLSEDAFSFNALVGAYERARRGRRYREDVLNFGSCLEEHLLELRDELQNGRYQHGPYRSFIVHDAKKRHIQAATFRDRIVHQAVNQALEPLFERGFIKDSYACRKGKGVLAAIKQFETFSRTGAYVLTADVSKYFATIDHETLLRLLSRRISDRQILQVCERIIRSIEESPGKGMPIGNLTSQLFANVYLNELDQFIKHTLRLKRYVRYMDDIAILESDKAVLHSAREQIESFVQERLLLELHPRKVQIAPIATGIDYLGYRIYPHHRMLRKSTVKRFIKRSRRAERIAGGGALTGKRCVRGWSTQNAPKAEDYSAR